MLEELIQPQGQASQNAINNLKVVYFFFNERSFSNAMHRLAEWERSIQKDLHGSRCGPREKIMSNASTLCS
jgi:hypothetical protein